MNRTRRLELIDKKEFAKETLDKDVDDFVIYMSSLNLELIIIDLAREVQIASLLTKKVIIVAKYPDFAICIPKESADCS